MLLILFRTIFVGRAISHIKFFKFSPETICIYIVLYRLTQSLGDLWGKGQDSKFNDTYSQSYGAPEGARKLKSFEWLDCTNNKVLNVEIAQTIKFRMSRLHKQ